MCIDGKTQALSKKLKPSILENIDNIDEARAMIDETKRTANSQVAHMAELFYENQEQFGIVRQVAQVRAHPLTKLSALRGAIVAVLTEYVDSHEKKLNNLALGSSSRVVVPA